jgi:hypothetical protein
VWDNRDVQELLQRYTQVYDHWNPDVRQPIENLATLPLIDDNRMEINVYTQDGYRVPRRKARLADQRPCGIFINLRSVGDSFLANEVNPRRYIDPDADPDFTPIRPASYQVFPQAYLRNHGHFQAKGLLSGFEPHIRQLNRIYGVVVNDNVVCREVDENINEEENQLRARHLQPISSIACQGYNEIMHRMRGKGAKYHDAQLGLITMCLAGTYASDIVGRRTFEAFRHRCNEDLLHQCFAHKINTDRVGTSFRLENVFTIDFAKMRPGMKEGK